MNNVMSLLTFNGIFKWSDTYIEKENQVFLAGDIYLGRVHLPTEPTVANGSQRQVNNM